MTGIVLSVGLTKSGPILFSMSSFRSSHFLWISSPIASFLGGHLLGMPGPVPGSGSPTLRPLSLFFGPELCDFVKVVVVIVVKVIVVVAWWVGGRGASVSASAAFFYARHREMVAVLAGAYGAA